MVLGESCAEVGYEQYDLRFSDENYKQKLIFVLFVGIDILYSHSVFHIMHGWHPRLVSFTLQYYEILRSIDYVILVQYSE